MDKVGLYKKTGENISCQICFRKCQIAPGKFGFCGVNTHREGELHCISDEYPAVMHLDPIEKKPLYHVHPGSSIFSIGTAGCNLTCPFCQNISLVKRRGQLLDKKHDSDAILDMVEEQGSRAIAFTYNEPSVSWLWYRDLAFKAKARSMLTVMVTNGSMGKSVRDEMVHCIDAVNIDLKAGSAKTYKERLGGNREAVLESIVDLHSRGVWVELTTLLVPDLSDSVEDLEVSATQIYDSVGPSLPWHLSAYYPAHKYSRPATSPQLVIDRCEMLRAKGFFYVYGGNIGRAQSTNCPGCGTPVIDRLSTVRNRLEGGSCPECLRSMEGVL